MDGHFITPSGSTAHIDIVGQGRESDFDASYVRLNLSSTSHDDETVRVRFTSPTLIRTALSQERHVEFSPDVQAHLATVATLREMDQNPDFGAPSDGERTIQLGPGEVLDLYTQPKLSDRDLRVYIERRVYQHYANTDLSQITPLGEVDQQVTGAGPRDFLRVSQVLAQEGYLELFETMGYDTMPSIRGTSKLVRAVERYGAVREDLMSDDNYAAKVGAAAALTQRREFILAQRHQYAVALSHDELTAIFRAVAPEVETVGRNLLAARGAGGNYGNLAGC